jgi:hypothetical protein
MNLHVNLLSCSKKYNTNIVPPDLFFRKSTLSPGGYPMRGDELISSYPEKELEIISDAFERFNILWEQQCEKIKNASRVADLSPKTFPGSVLS